MISYPVTAIILAFNQFIKRLYGIFFSAANSIELPVSVTYWHSTRHPNVSFLFTNKWHTTGKLYLTFTWTKRGNKNKILIEIVFNWKTPFFVCVFFLSLEVVDSMFWDFFSNDWICKRNIEKKRYFTLQCKSFEAYWVTLMDCDSRFKNCLLDISLAEINIVQRIK